MFSVTQLLASSWPSISLLSGKNVLSFLGLCVFSVTRFPQSPGSAPMEERCRWWIFEPLKSSWCSGAAPISRCNIMLPEVSEVPPPGSGLIGGYGMVWKKLPLHFSKNGSQVVQLPHLCISTPITGTIHSVHSFATERLSPWFSGLHTPHFVVWHSVLQFPLVPVARSGMQGGCA